MNIILKTTHRKVNGLKLYKVERVYDFNPVGYAIFNPYFDTPDRKYKKFEYNGYSLNRYIKRDTFGEILEEVLISSKK